MPENVVDLLSKIQSVKGQEYVKGLVDMANILAPEHTEKEQEGGESGGLKQ
jgi:hypothetical protein